MISSQQGSLPLLPISHPPSPLPPFLKPNLSTHSNLHRRDRFREIKRQNGIFQHSQVRHARALAEHCP